MTPPAFVHLPELQGRLIPAHACGLRLTDEVLAEWDAQARSQKVGGEHGLLDVPFGFHIDTGRLHMAR